MAFGITDLKKGVLFQLDGEPYKVLDYSQKVMGRGGSIVNVRIRGLKSGKVLDKTFKGNEHVEPAEVSNMTVQYLYSDGPTFFFMNPGSFEQFELPAADMEGKSAFMKEGDEVTAQLFDGRIISVELPKNVPLKVVYAEEAVKGDTSGAVHKNATLETGATLKVPAFVKTGDLISVDTATGTYRERVK